MTRDIHGVDELVTILEDLAINDADGNLTVQEVVEGFGIASRLPLIVALALIVVSPLSGIFFLPTILGLIIAALGLQMFFGKRRLWLPGFILRRSLSAERVANMAARMHGVAQWLDARSRRRLSLLVRAPVRLFLPLVIAGCGALMPFLELVPFSSSILGLAITLICAGLILSDGLFVAFALVFIGGAAMIPVWLFL